MYIYDETEKASEFVNIMTDNIFEITTCRNWGQHVVPMNEDKWSKMALNYKTTE